MIAQRHLITLAASIPLWAWIGSADAEERPFEVELELGSAWQARNDVQIPGDMGTRFALDDVVGSGPWVTGRVNFNWNVKGRPVVREHVEWALGRHTLHSHSRSEVSS